MSRSDIRSQILAKKAAKLSREGFTAKQIAEAVGIRPDQVKTRVALGERLLSLDDVAEEQKP